MALAYIPPPYSAADRARIFGPANGMDPKKRNAEQQKYRKSKSIFSSMSVKAPPKQGGSKKK